jgi:hypothetical protein
MPDGQTKSVGNWNILEECLADLPTVEQAQHATGGDCEPPKPANTQDQPPTEPIHTKAPPRPPPVWSATVVTPYGQTNIVDGWSTLEECEDARLSQEALVPGITCEVLQTSPAGPERVVREERGIPRHFTCW